MRERFALSRLRTPSATQAIQLLGLCGFALAQPLYAVLGEAPEFFAIRGSAPFDLVALILALIVYRLTLA